MFKRFLGFLALLTLVIAACTPPAPPAVKVTSVSPAAGATAVSVASQVTATFNVAVTKATLDEAFSVSSGDGEVAGNIAYNTGTRTATFTPIAPLAYDTEYTATLSTALRSSANGRLTSAYSWTFTTEEAPAETPAVTAVEVSPASATLTVGETAAFTADVTATGGASEAVAWSSSNETVATVDADGLVTALAAGTATITATSDFDDTVSGTGTVTVNAAPVEPAVSAVTVSPANAAAIPAQTRQFTADVTAVGGASQAVTWSSSDDTIATVDADGLATAVAPGTATITATSTFDTTVSGSATLSVTAAPAVSSVTVDPLAAPLEIGDSATLVVHVAASGGADESVTWSSDDETVATVDEDGVVTAVAAGTATITATSTFDTTVSGSADVEVLAPTVTAVTVDPATATVDAGGTQQFTAAVTAVSGASEAVTWSSSDDTIATVDADGLATAVAPGTATITATSTFDTTVSGTAILNVAGVTDVAIDPAELHLALAQTGALTANVTALHGAAETVTWASDDEAVATVDAAGIVTAVAVGTANITATSTVNTAAIGTAAVTVHGPVTINHFMPLNVLTGTGVLNESLGAAGGYGPYSYAYSLVAPAGWPVGYPEVPADYDPTTLPFRLPPDGVTLDQDAGALVGSSSEVGDYRFFVVVTDALGQTDYALIELDFGYMFLTIDQHTYTYPVGCGSGGATACGGGGTFTIGGGPGGTTYSRVIPQDDIHVVGVRTGRNVTYTMELVVGGGTGTSNSHWAIQSLTGTIGRTTSGGMNTSNANNGTRTYRITAHESGGDGRTATATVVFEPQ